MRYLRNIGIGSRLFAGFTLVLSLCVVITAVAIWRLQVIDRATRDLMETPLLKERLISDLNANVAAGVRRTLAIVKSSDPSLATFFAPDAAELTKGGSEIQKKVADLIAGADEKAVFDRLVKARAEYISMRDAIMKEKSAGNIEATNKLFDERFNPAVVGYQTALKDMLKFQRETIDRIGAEISKVSAQSSTLLTVFAGLLVALGGVCAWLLTKSITTPLTSALRIVTQVAQGELATRAQVAEKDELGRLLNALNEMSNNLVRIVSSVRSGTSAMATATGEIASGNQDLSSRTEQQASSLQETAASMGQLTSTVRQNADNARQANQLAMTASNVAAKGGQVVSQVVDTMGSINESSRKIVDIIGVIDGIAFQTNILALNAAVEAARAGDQGRGFAVVASEVRSLAQRSADAAKEIKGLIGASVEKVETGSKLVDHAGATMEEVVASIRRVTEIMSGITTASQEQSAGIEQVNQAIAQMDQVTQQNAALVEQAAAAARSMQDQAASLSGLVDVFKLEDKEAALA